MKSGARQAGWLSFQTGVPFMMIKLTTCLLISGIYTCKFEGSYIPSQQCQLASDVEEHDMRIINRTVLLETMRAGHENLAPLRRSAIVLTRQQPETSAMT